MTFTSLKYFFLTLMILRKIKKERKKLRKIQKKGNNKRRTKKQLRVVFSKENNQTLLYNGKGQTGQDVYIGQWEDINNLLHSSQKKSSFKALRKHENPQDHFTK